MQSWTKWTPGPIEECLGPQESWEGANFPLSPGKIGALDKPIRALRDPERAALRVGAGRSAFLIIPTEQPAVVGDVP